MNDLRTGEFIIRWINEDIIANNRTIKQMRTMFSGNSFFDKMIQSREDYTKKLEQLKYDYYNGKFLELVQFYTAYTNLSRQR